MACLDVITRPLKPGDEVIAGDDLYGGTNRLLTYLKNHNGVIVHHVDTTDTKAVLPQLSDKTAMVLLESPTNPLLKIADLEEIIIQVKARCPKAVVVVDNTMMSPYLQRPLELGADLVYDSATKYLSGHHDLMAGVITCNRDDLAQVSSQHSHLSVTSLLTFWFCSMSPMLSTVLVTPSPPSILSFFCEGQKLWQFAWTDNKLQRCEWLPTSIDLDSKSSTQG